MGWFNLNVEKSKMNEELQDLRNDQADDKAATDTNALADHIDDLTNGYYDRADILSVIADIEAEGDVATRFNVIDSLKEIKTGIEGEE